MNRQSTFIPLEEIKIASPCHADWNKMHGDDCTRFCQSCAKNVYNFSEMSRPQAEALLIEKEGNLCVRYFQRADGTVITDDCPIAIKMVRRPLKWMAGVAAAILASGLSLVRGQANPGPQKPAATAANPQPIPLAGMIAPSNPHEAAPKPKPGKPKKHAAKKTAAKAKVPAPRLRMGEPAATMGTPPATMGASAPTMGQIKAPVAAPTPRPLTGKPMMPRPKMGRFIAPRKDD